MSRWISLALAGLCALARPGPVEAAEEGGRCEILVSVVRGASPVHGPVEVRRLFALDDNMEGVVCLPLFERILAGPDLWKPVATATAGEVVDPGLTDSISVTRPATAVGSARSR